MAIITKFSETKTPTSKIDGTIFNNQGTPAPMDSFKCEAQPQLADHVKENEELEKKSFIGSDAVEPPKLSPDIEASRSPRLSGIGPAESPNLPDSIDQEQVQEYITSDTFEKLFNIDPKVFEAIKKNMQDFAYDRDRPVTLGIGPWTSKPVVIDGHTRLKAALELGVESTFVTKTFLTEDDAFYFVVHEHKNRRNLTDAEKCRLVKAVDEKLKKGGDTRAIATPVANGKPARSSDITAEKTGIPRGTVEKIRKVTAEDTPLEIKEAVESGEISINKGYNEIVKSKSISKARKLPSTSLLPPPVITQSRVSTASWMIELQTIINDVAVEKTLFDKDITELEDKMTSIALDMEYDISTLLLAGAYFREHDIRWGPAIKRVECLPKSFLIKFWRSFDGLLDRIDKKVDAAGRLQAQREAENKFLWPELDPFKQS